jgi:hypothetical protein
MGATLCVIDKVKKSFWVGAVPKLYEEDEAFSRQMQEEQSLELEHRCLMELHMASAQQRRAEAEASMAMVAAQSRSLVTAGFPANELSLPGEGTNLTLQSMRCPPASQSFWKLLR